MKRLLLIAAIFTLSGCSYFIQISTFESDSVKLLEDDRFVYSDDIVTIEYKINNEGPIFDFRITNNTNQEITIDLSKSYFVYNKDVYDYAGRSSTITTHSFNFVSRSYSTLSVGNATGISISETQAIGDKLIIPAACNRTFSGFPIDRKIYRDATIVKGIESKTPVTLTLTKEESPVRIMNVIAILYNDKEHKVVNEMYVKDINVRPISQDSPKVLIFDDQMHIIYEYNELWY